MTTVERGSRINPTLLLFGIPFTALPLLLLVMSVIPHVRDGWQMNSWHPIHAELLSADLEAHSSKGSITHAVKASYRYRWQGVTYTSSRVGIAAGYDNLGDWHQETYLRLLGSRYISVWVNPEAPYEAVIDRNVRWGLIAFEMAFVVVFGGIGLAFIVGGLRPRPPSFDAAVQATSPLTPDWEDGYIRPEGRGEILTMWAIGSIMSLTAIFIYYLRDEFFAKEAGPHLLFLLFPLFGLSLLIQAAIKDLRLRRFGGALLRLEPYPGESGGKVSGAIELPRLPQESSVRVRLSCLHVYWEQSQRKRARKEKVLWQDEHLYDLKPGFGAKQVEFAFHPPAGLPASSTGANYHMWLLTIEADLDGPDLALNFELPVAQAAIKSAEEASRDSAEIDAELPAWLQISHQGSALELFLPLFRGRAVGIPMTLSGGIFAVIGVLLMLYSGAPLFFSVLFALMGTLFFLLGLYTLGNSLQVRITRDSVELLRRIFGIAFVRRIDTQQVSDVSSRIGMQSGRRAFYHVELKLKNGRSATVADSLPGAGAANQLIAMIRRHIK